MPTLLGTDWGHSHIRGPVPTPARLLSLAKGSPHNVALIWRADCFSVVSNVQAAADENRSDGQASLGLILEKR